MHIDFMQELHKRKKAVKKGISQREINMAEDEAKEIWNDNHHTRESLKLLALTLLIDTYER